MYSDEEGKCYDESGKLITTNGDDYVFACVSWLISKGADPNALDSLGNTPLIDEIQYINDPSDCYKMCLLLLQNNADPNKVGRFALPPLLTATILNKPSIVRLLLVYGANPNYETANKTRLFIKIKESALSYASRNGLYEVVEILLKSKGYKLSMLFNAILEADPRAKEMIATSLEFTPTTPKPSPTTVI